jgi:hypothetical protein
LFNQPDSAKTINQAMISQDKIDEWLKEVEARPASAALIVQFIANRLRDLAARNEELTAENLALLTGKRVEEFERRIAHLEYQLDLLKRRAADLPAGEAGLAAIPAAETTPQALLYAPDGRILRLLIEAEAFAGGLAGELAGSLPAGLRLLVVNPEEELLLLFSSGRVALFPARAIPTPGGSPTWEQAALLDEPRGGEILACVAPVSGLALAEFFYQVSRRGYVKKVGMSMSASVLANRFLGAGTLLPADQPCEAGLGGKDDRLALVTREGFLIVLETKRLAFAAEQSLRLGAADHVTAAFRLPPGRALLAMTQIGKLIHRDGDGLETAQTLKTHGEALYSLQRRSQGVRIAGAGAAAETSWCLALHTSGRLSLHSARQLAGEGALPPQGELAAFTVFDRPGAAG